MTSLATTHREPHLGQASPSDVSVARGPLERADLLEQLDRALTKLITVVSASPESEKPAHLRAVADRPTELLRPAFVSVKRDERNAQQFWSAVLDPILGSA